MVENNSVLVIGTRYEVIDKINIALDQAFIYLSNPDDPTDICIRKEKQDLGETLLVALDNEAEVEQAMQFFIQKNGRK